MCTRGRRNGAQSVQAYREAKIGGKPENLFRKSRKKRSSRQEGDWGRGNWESPGKWIVKEIYRQEKELGAD